MHQRTAAAPGARFERAPRSRADLRFKGGSVGRSRTPASYGAPCRRRSGFAALKEPHPNPRRRRGHGAGRGYRSRLCGLEGRGTSVYTRPAWRRAESTIPMPSSTNRLAIRRPRPGGLTLRIWPRRQDSNPQNCGSVLLSYAERIGDRARARTPIAGLEDRSLSRWRTRSWRRRQESNLRGAGCSREPRHSATPSNWHGR